MLHRKHVFGKSHAAADCARCPDYYSPAFTAQEAALRTLSEASVSVAQPSAPASPKPKPTDLGATRTWMEPDLSYRAACVRRTRGGQGGGLRTSYDMVGWLVGGLIG